MKGKTPKPTLLKLLAGNPGRRPINDSEPIPERPLDKAPDHLSPRQKEIWDEALASAPPGLLANLDESLLMGWVVARAIHEEATVQVNKLGHVIKSPVKGVPMQNPYLAILNRQAVLMAKFASELGFSPVARSRVRVGGANGKKTGNRFSNNGKRPDPA